MNYFLLLGFGGPGVDQLPGTTSGQILSANRFDIPNLEIILSMKIGFA
jgi:hypothetical protein